MPDPVVEFVIQGATLDGKPFRPSDRAFPLYFAKDNELQVRDGRVAERTKLAELQRVTPKLAEMQRVTSEP